MKKLRVLHLIKYSLHSNGGMESYLNNIIKYLNEDFNFTIFSFSKSSISENKIFNNANYILKKPFFIYKSQPISLNLKIIKNLILNNDIIHLHFPFPIFELYLFLNYKLLRKKKLVITWHANIDNTRWKHFNFIYKFIYIKLLMWSYKIIITNESLIENNLILSNFKNKVEVIPIGIDLKHHVNIKSIDNKNNFKILFVGKLRNYKGLNYLIDAFKFLPINYKLQIIGNGEEYNNLKNLILLNNLNSRIEILDNVDNNDLSNFYKDADLFILPSISEAEAFGIVQLEAMSYGLPIINTNLKSGVPKISINNYTGKTIEPKNIKDIAGAILFLTTDKNIYFQFSRNCLKHIKKFDNFTINKQLKLLYLQ